MSRFLLTAILVVALAPPVLACDFCAGPSNFTSVQADIVKSSQAAIGKLVRRTAEGKAVFLVQATLAGSATVGGEVALSVKIRTPRRVFLLLATKADWSDGRVRAIGPRVVDFIAAWRGLPKGADTTRKLAFYLPYLADSDALVAASALSEYAEAPYAEVAKLKPQLKAAQLIAWLDAPSTAASSRGVLLLMLGLCATEKDRPKLEAWLADEDWQQEPGYDALVAAYVLLRGPAGWGPVDKALAGVRAGNRGRPGFAILRALRFVEREKLMPRARVLVAVRSMLRYPSAAEGTLFELERYKDWDALDQVLAFHTKHGRRDRPWLTEAVKDYLDACPRKKAKAALEELGG